MRRFQHLAPVTLAYMSTGVALAGTPTGGVLFLAVLVAALLPIILMFVGVVLPAVWSRHHGRRNAAAAVLAQILTALRRRPQ